MRFVLTAELMMVTSDWPACLKNQATMGHSRFALFAQMFCDQKSDASLLSPASVFHRAEIMQAPLLIVHGRDDPEGLYDQARALMKAVDKANRPYELMTKYDEAHGFRTYISRVDLGKRIEAFLAKHMQADVAASR